MKFSGYRLFAGCAAVLFCLTGCSSLVNAHRQKEPMMRGYLAGNQAEVAAVLDDKLKDPSWYNSSTVNTGDEVMWRLESGTNRFLTGKDDAGIADFARAEDLMADFDGRALVNMRSVGAEGAVLFTNPNALPYRGWCRDRIMLPVFKALAYLGKEDEAGFRTELFRLRENQQKVMDEYNRFFEAENAAVARAKKGNAAAAGSVNPDHVLADPRNRELSQEIEATGNIAHRGYGTFLNPLAIFLSGYGYARDGDWQNAVVDFERLYKAMPDNPLVRQYYVTALGQARRKLPDELKEVKPLDFPIGRDNVLVIFADGRSAALRQVALYIPVVFPGYATIAATAWPICEYYPAPYKMLEVAAGGKTYRTVLIADMDGILAQEYTSRLPGMITRIVLSTAVKEAGSYLAARAVDKDDTLAQVAVMGGAALYKTAMNTADTRGWEMLPKEFQLIQFPMPPDRRVAIAPDGRFPVTIALPERARSAILYVNAPGGGAQVLAWRILSLTNQ